MASAHSSEVDLSSIPLATIGTVVKSSDGKEEVKPERKDVSFETMTAVTRTTALYEHPHFHVVMRADFFDGYTLRQLFEFYKQSLTCAPMVFTDGDFRGITTTRGNSSAHGPTMVVNTRIRGDDLVDFFIDHERWNAPGQKSHIVNVNLTEFHSQIKGVAKKESIRLYQFAEYPDRIFLQFYGGNKNSDGYVHVRTEAFEHIDYQNEDGVDESVLPNVKVPLPMFCSACSNIVKSKYLHGILNVYPRGAHFVGSSEIGTSSRNSHWGDCSTVVKRGRLIIESKDGPTHYSTRIPSPVIKSLTKIANFNPGSIVKVYGQGDSLVRLDVTLGAYADVTIHLIDPIPVT